MSWLGRAKPVLVAVGLVALGVSLLGARRLNPPTAADAPPPGAGGAAPKSALPAGANGQPIGTVVLGYVDSDPPPVLYSLPPAMQAGLVVKVNVREGDAVKPGDELYRFDDTIQQGEVARAVAAIGLAQAKLDEARALVDQHVRKVQLAKIALDGAELAVRQAREAVTLSETNFRKSYKAQGYAEATWEERLGEEPDVFRRRSAYSETLIRREAKKAELEATQAERVDLMAKEAEAAVGQAKAAEQTARAALDLCGVKARGSGTVEQVTVTPGMVLGIGGRGQGVLLVPDGPRVVRAEVEAEFARKVADKLDKPVTVFDHTDPRLTYPGVVRRIGSSFLDKRSSGVGLVMNETRVLECRIEVLDSAPAGKPPLLVGQKVRIGFGP